MVDKNHKYLPNESFTDASLFANEMKYLHDNGFIVLKTSDLGFDPITKDLYKRNIQHNSQKLLNEESDIFDKTYDII